MATERILITVKTYPTLSRTYGELVCTAGLREDGSWIRIYPIPFRRLEAYKKYKKYSFINAEVIPSTSDTRKESHKVNLDNFQLTGEHIDTRDCWRQRREWVIDRGGIHTNLTSLIEANKRGEVSLATFKPSRILDLKIKPESPNWSEDKLIALKAAALQEELFSQWNSHDLTRLTRKLPWKFSYVVEDDAGKKSTMMIEDWEIGELYWNCLKTSPTPEVAAEKVKQKYLYDFSKLDIYLFLGTTKQYDRRAPNPFVIIGVFYPPFQNQGELKLFDL